MAWWSARPSHTHARCAGGCTYQVVLCSCGEAGAPSQQLAALVLCVRHKLWCPQAKMQSNHTNKTRFPYLGGCVNRSLPKCSRTPAAHNAWDVRQRKRPPIQVGRHAGHPPHPLAPAGDLVPCAAGSRQAQPPQLLLDGLQVGQLGQRLLPNVAPCSRPQVSLW
jgi:hypothetical protein